MRRAESQIRALFNRRLVDIFPPPGPDRRDSFFAETLPSTESNARLYVSVAAQGRSSKVAMLRVYLALLGAALKWHSLLKKKGEALTPADPYMTLLGYYNSLRELGRARRLIEDEIRNRLAGYSNRKRVGETEGLFDDRQIDYEPVELTSRVSTADVADAKRRLALLFIDKGRVDVAIATNMISVGLDITRLTGADGGVWSAEDQRGIHPGHQPGRARSGPARSGRDDLQRARAAGPVALREVRGVPQELVPQRGSDQRHAFLAARAR